MSHAERIVNLLLENAPTIRGEYWIIDGDVSYADGDVGDMNHEAYAIDHARRNLIEHFGGDSDGEFIGEEELTAAAVEALTEAGIPVNPDDWYPAAKRLFSEQPDSEKMIATLQCALGMGDAREVAMKYWGWKWCRKNNIATWTFTSDDRRSIVSGLNEIISQEMDDDESWDELEITIGVGATGKRYSMTMAELESGRSVSRDPTWGGMEEALDPDGMMAYMEPEIIRLTRRRKLAVGEEVSNGTFCMIDLCRRGLAKLEEIDYAGYKQFVAQNSELIDSLAKVVASNAAGVDYGNEPVDDTVAAHESIETLWESLVEVFNSYYCLYATYFGSNDGCGSCFGCWPDEDYLQDRLNDYRVIFVRTDKSKFPERVEPDPNAADNWKVWFRSDDGHQALYDARTGEKIWEY